MSALSGVDLPSYHGDYVSAADRQELASLISGELGPWRLVDDGREQPLDAVLLKIGGYPSHVGTVVRRGLMLHMAFKRTSVIEPYQTGRFSVAGIYRHEAVT